MAIQTITLRIKESQLEVGIKPKVATVTIYPVATNGGALLKVVKDTAGGTRISGHVKHTATAGEITAGVIDIVLPDPRDTSLMPTGYGYRVRVVTNYFTPTPDVEFGPTEITANIDGSGVLLLEKVMPTDAAAFVAVANYASAADLTALRGGTDSAFETRLAATFAALGGDVVTRTTSGALAVGKTNAADATSGALAVTLANATSKGILTPVYKADGSANVVTITLKLRGSSSTSTLTLSSQSQGMLFISRADGTYDVAADHRTQASLDTAYKAPVDALRTAWARNPDQLVAGTVTRDGNGAATSAPVVWPDGSPGTYTADTVSTAFPGAVDGYHITYGSPVTKTYTQPTVTRNTSGAATTVPVIVVS